MTNDTKLPSHKLKIKTCEYYNNKWNPVLIHTFLGNTEEEIAGLIDAHRQTDSFFDASFSGFFKYSRWTELGWIFGDRIFRENVFITSGFKGWKTMQVPQDYVFEMIRQALDDKIVNVQRELKEDISNVQRELKEDISNVQRELKENTEDLKEDIDDYKNNCTSNCKNYEGKIRNLEETKYKIYAVSATIAGLSGFITYIIDKVW